MRPAIMQLCMQLTGVVTAQCHGVSSSSPMHVNTWVDVIVMQCFTQFEMAGPEQSEPVS